MVISQIAEIKCPEPAQIDEATKPLSVSVVSDAVVRKVRIQVGVVSRLVKEHGFYLKESAELLVKIEQMRNDNACVHDVKQMSEVYADSRKMIPQVLAQLGVSRDALFALLGKHTSEIDVLDCPEYIRLLILDARRCLADASLVLLDSPKISKANDPDSSEGSEY